MPDDIEFKWEPLDIPVDRIFPFQTPPEDVPDSSVGERLSKAQSLDEAIAAIFGNHMRFPGVMHGFVYHHEPEEGPVDGFQATLLPYPGGDNMWMVVIFLVMGGTTVDFNCPPFEADTVEDAKTIGGQRVLGWFIAALGNLREALDGFTDDHFEGGD